MSIRIMIADDHQILRAGLKSLLQADPNLEVVAEATNGDEAILIAEEFKPDIALMDISMPGIDSLQVTRQMLKTLPETRILMLTMHEDCALLREFLSAGASGYIIKRAAESELIDAIYAVWRGMIYVHPSLMRALVSTPQKVNPFDGGDAEPLTSREIEVLRYIVRGHTNRQIASALSISVRTVETHRSNLMEKLNLHSRAELVQYANEHDLEKREGQ
jgi:two-component system, NarL family, response regulator NreC